MTIKGSIVGGICGFAVATPLRGAAERLLVSTGHRFPTNRTVQSFSRHFGSRIMDREGEDFERIVTFASGGKMRCGAMNSASCWSDAGRLADSVAAINLKTLPSLTTAAISSSSSEWITPG